MTIIMWWVMRWVCVNQLSGDIAQGRAVEWRTKLTVSCLQECRWCTTIVLARHLQHWAKDRRQRTEAGDGSRVSWNDWKGAQRSLQRCAGEIFVTITVTYLQFIEPSDGVCSRVCRYNIPGLLWECLRDAALTFNSSVLYCHFLPLVIF